MTRTIQLLTMTAITGLAFTLACGGGKSEKAVKSYEDLSRRACSCADLVCAKGVLNDFKKVAADYKDITTNQEQLNRIQEATKTMTICIMKKGVTLKDIQEVAETVNKLSK